VRAICNKTLHDLDATAQLGLPADCHMSLQCKHVFGGVLSGFAGSFSSYQLNLLINKCLPRGSVMYHEEDFPVVKAEDTYKTANHRRSLRQGSIFERNSAIDGKQLNLRSLFQDQDINLLGEKQQKSALWNLDRLDQQRLPLDKTYSFGTDESRGVGQGVIIYVLDTGIMAEHQEFQTWSSVATNATTGTASRSRASCGRDFVEGSTNCEDIDGHGSHVAGTSIGLQVGVAKGASVVAVKILNDQGFGSVATTIAGLEYVAATRKIKQPAVVVLSLGVQRGQYSQAMEDAVRALVDRGVMVLAAAGNGAGDSCQFSPGATPQAFTVAASDYYGKFNDLNRKNAIKDVENDGVYDQGNQGPCVDLFAPGVDIYSVCGGIRRCGHISNITYAYASGSSMAVPHAAGAAALYLEAYPDASPSEVAEALKGAAVDGVISPVALREGTVNKLLQVKGLGRSHMHAAAVKVTAGGTATLIDTGKK
jgi:hypothetical protein